MRSTLVCALLAVLAMPARDPETRRDEDLPPRGRQRLVAGPELGLVFEKEAGQLRRVLGLPGAASLGPAIDAGVPLVGAVPCPRRDSALGITAGGEVVRVGPNMPAQPLGVPPSPDSVTCSPGGEWAALLYRADGRMALVRVATGSARLVELGGLDGTAGPYAVADDSTLLVMTSAGSVVLLEEEGMRIAGALRHAAAAAFLPGSRDALVADDAEDQVYLLRNGGFVPVAGSGQGVAGPVAVESHGGRAVIANARTGTVLSVDLVDGTSELIECSCRPDSLSRTSQPGAWWIAERLLFEDGPSGRRVVFVAPAQTER